MLNKTYQLIIRRGPNEGQEFSLTSVITTIGRDPMADVTINDPELSRQHARLVETAVGYELEDLGSTNGTYVDGQLLAGGPVPLQPGQEIVLGSNVALLFVAVETAVEQPATPATIIVPPEPEEAPAWAAPELEEVEVVMVEETAVVPDEPTAPELESEAAAEATAEDVDPMLPPAFDDLPAYPDLPEIRVPDAADFDLPDLPEFPELDEEPIIRRTPPPPPKAAPRVISAKTDTLPPPSKSGGITTKRVVGILAGVLALMLCCCCGFLFFMWQWGGDWLLRQMQFIP